jgi:hypothetical protein
MELASEPELYAQEIARRRLSPTQPPLRSAKALS